MPTPFSSPSGRIIEENLPVFAPKRIVQATADTEWTPLVSDIAFFASEFTTFTLGEGDSSSTYVNLEPGQVMGIIPGTTFTFSTTVALAVM